MTSPEETQSNKTPPSTGTACRYDPTNKGEGVMNFATDHLEEVIVSRETKKTRNIGTIGNQSLTILPSLLVKRKEAAAAGNDSLVVTLDNRINALRASYRRG